MRRSGVQCILSFNLEDLMKITKRYPDECLQIECDTASQRKQVQEGVYIPV